MDVPFLRGWGNSQSMFPLKLLEKVVGRQIFSTVRIGGLDIIMFFRYFFHAFVDFLRWSLFFRSYLSGRCRETRTFTKGFQQYDPISRKTRVVWIIDKWVWFPHDFQIRRLWWCTCWASSSSEGWMAMGSIKTQQWRLSSVLWPWSSGSVLGQERIRISSRWSTTCLAEIALRIRPPVEDGQGSWRWRYEIFGSMDLLYHVVQLEEKSQLVPKSHHGGGDLSTERGEDPASIIVGRNHEGRPTSLQDLVEYLLQKFAPWIASWTEAEVVKWDRQRSSVEPASQWKVLSAENYGVLMCWFISFPHFIQWKKTWQYR